MRSFTLVAAVLLLGACKPKTIDTPNDTAPGDDDDSTSDDDDDTVGDDDDDTVGDDDDDGITFDAHIVGLQPGVKYAAVADVDGDGVDEIITSAWNDITDADIPYGTIQVWDYAGDLDSWTMTEALGENALIRSPNEIVTGDIDNDGDIDIVAGFGSRYCEPIEAVPDCGGIVVLENDGGIWNRYTVLNQSRPYYRGVELADINNDGNLDIIGVAERTTLQDVEAFVQIFQGDGSVNFDNPLQIGQGLGPFPTAVDIDGDGDLDLMGGEQASGNNSFSWFENQGGAWAPHVIYDNLGKGNMIRIIDDLYGDGVTRALATNHTNTETPKKLNPDIHDSQLVAFEIPANPILQWSSYDVVSDGVLPTPDLGLFPRDAPGTFDVGDADGDGDNDILLAGDGDPTVYLLDQVSPGEFVTRVLRPNVLINGGTHMTDFNGDGAPEFVVVSFGTDQVYVIERVGG